MNILKNIILSIMALAAGYLAMVAFAFVAAFIGGFIFDPASVKSAAQQPFWRAVALMVWLGTAGWLIWKVWRNDPNRSTTGLAA